MENASKALIMAAEILIGVMILSIGVYLFNLFAGYSSSMYQKIEDTQIAEFNDRFLKFYGSRKNDLGKDVPIECTIHDIMSLANFAQKHNLEYNLIEQTTQKNKTVFQKKNGVTLENSLYIQIDLDNIQNLELKTNSELISLIKNNDLTEGVTGIKNEVKYYKCTICEPRGNNKRINYVKFVKI